MLTLLLNLYTLSSHNTSYSTLCNFTLKTINSFVTIFVFTILSNVCCPVQRFSICNYLITLNSRLLMTHTLFFLSMIHLRAFVCSFLVWVSAQMSSVHHSSFPFLSFSFHLLFFFITLRSSFGKYIFTYLSIFSPARCSRYLK